MENSKEKILKAAKEEFYEMGFSGARVDKIAFRSGLNKAMIYYHFENKENLYAKVLETLIDNLVSTIKPVITENTTVEQIIKKLMDDYSNFLINNPQNPKIFLMELASGGFYLKDIFREKLLPLFMSLRAIISKNVLSGEIKDIDYKFAVFSIISPFILFFIGKPIFEIVTGKEYDEDTINEFKEFIFETIYYGIKKDRS